MSRLNFKPAQKENKKKKNRSVVKQECELRRLNSFTDVFVLSSLLVKKEIVAKTRILFTYYNHILICKCLNTLYFNFL